MLELNDNTGDKEDTGSWVYEGGSAATEEYNKRPCVLSITFLQSQHLQHRLKHCVASGTGQKHCLHASQPNKWSS